MILLRRDKYALAQEKVMSVYENVFLTFHFILFA